MAPQEHRRLDSWKDIAAYLDRDVSTVMRWEKGSGMPVHRVPGAKPGQSVFAYTDELDAWMTADPSKAADPLELPTTPRFGGPAAVFLGAASVLAGILVLVATGLVGDGGFAGPAAGGPASGSVTAVEAIGDMIVARNMDTEVAWTHRHADGYSYENVQLGEALDLQGDGRLEVLVAANASDSARTAFQEGELSSFSESGVPRWRIVIDAAYLFGEARYSSPWISRGAYVHRMNGESRIVWRVNHYTWWPSVLVLLNDAGEIIGKFVNSGWLDVTNVLPRPGGDLLLAGGTSNSHESAVLAVLDSRRISGHSPEEPGSPYECLDCDDGRPLRYLVFPRSEVNRALGLPYNRVARIEVTDDQVNVVVREGSPQSDLQWVYELTHDFELLRATPGDTYWPQHRLLRLEGKIDHSEEVCPERAPPSIRSWTPEDGWAEMRPRQR